MSDEVKCDDDRSHHCNFSPEEIAAFKTTFENGRAMKKGMITTLAGLLVLALVGIILLGFALTLKAVSAASTGQLIERVTGLKEPKGQGE